MFLTTVVKNDHDVTVPWATREHCDHGAAEAVVKVNPRSGDLWSKVWESEVKILLIVQPET